MVCFSFLLSEQLMFIICRFHMCKNLLKSTPTVLPQSFTDTHSSKQFQAPRADVPSGGWNKVFSAFLFLPPYNKHVSFIQSV